MEVDRSVGTLFDYITDHGVDQLDHVLLELLTDDFQRLIDISERTASDNNPLIDLLTKWRVFRYISHCLSKPNGEDKLKLITPETERFALQILSKIILDNSVFMHMSEIYPSVLTNLVDLCSNPDVVNFDTATIVLRMLLRIQSSVQGRNWLQTEGVWTSYVRSYLSHNGGRFRYEIERRMAAAMADEILDHASYVCTPDNLLIGQLSQFLIVMPSRFNQAGSSDVECVAPWRVCCQLITRTIYQCLSAGVAVNSVYSGVISGLSQQVSSLCRHSTDVAVWRPYLLLLLAQQRISQETPTESDEGTKSIDSSSTWYTSVLEHSFMEKVRCACIAIASDNESNASSQSHIISLILDLVLVAPFDQVLVSVALAPLLTVLTQESSQSCLGCDGESIEFIKRCHGDTMSFISANQLILSAIAGGGSQQSHVSSLVAVTRIYRQRLEAPGGVSASSGKNMTQPFSTVFALAQVWTLALRLSIKHPQIMSARSLNDIITIISRLLSIEMLPTIRTSSYDRTQSASMTEIHDSSNSYPRQPCIPQLASTLADLLLTPSSSDDPSQLLIISALKCIRCSAKWLVPFVDDDKGSHDGFNHLINTLSDLLSTNSECVESISQAVGAILAVCARRSSQHPSEHSSADTALTPPIPDRLVLDCVHQLLNPGYVSTCFDTVERQTVAELVTSCAVMARSGYPALWLYLYQNLDIVCVMESAIECGVVFDAVGLLTIADFIQVYAGAGFDQGAPSQFRYVLPKVPLSQAHVYVQCGLASTEDSVRHAAEDCAALLIKLALDGNETKELDCGKDQRSGDDVGSVSTYSKNNQSFGAERWLYNGYAAALLNVCERSQKYTAVLDALVGAYSGTPPSETTAFNVNTAVSQAVEAAESEKPTSRLVEDRERIAREVLDNTTADFLRQKLAAQPGENEQPTPGHKLAKLSAPPMETLTAEQFLSRALDLKSSRVQETVIIPNASIPVTIRAIEDRVEEIQCCANMDRKLDVPTDCY